MTPAASLFAAGPAIVKAAIGEVVSKENLGGPQAHLASGLVHNLAEDDAAARSDPAAHRPGSGGAL